jgi:hypothetical protein
MSSVQNFLTPVKEPKPPKSQDILTSSHQVKCWASSLRILDPHSAVSNVIVREDVAYSAWVTQISKAENDASMIPSCQRHSITLRRPLNTISEYILRWRIAIRCRQMLKICAPPHCKISRSDRCKTTAEASRNQSGKAVYNLLMNCAVRSYHHQPPETVALVADQLSHG